MKTTIVQYVVWILAVLILVSCGNGYDAVDDYIKMNRSFEKGYISTNTSIVEQALLTHRARLLEMQQNGAQGINFNHTLALVNARLSYFYHKVGQTNEALKYFNIATNHMNIRERKEGKAGVMFTPQDVYDIVIYADKHIPRRTEGAK